MGTMRDASEIYPELEGAEYTEAPDPKRAAAAVQAARQEHRFTDELAEQAEAAFTALKKTYDENHFVDKLRLAIRRV